MPAKKGIAEEMLFELARATTAEHTHLASDQSAC